MDPARYAELFLTESRDNLSAINHALLELERDPERGGAHIDALFRAVHTVKGMSATMGYTSVAELCHDLETVLDLVRRGDADVGAELMDVLFRATDALERAIELCATGRPADVDVSRPREQLMRFAAPAPAAPAAPVASRRSGEAGSGASGSERAKRSSRRASRKGAPAASDEPDGPAAGGATILAGRVVTVRVGVAEGAPLRGVRAYLTVQKAGTVGDVVGVQPSVDELQTEAFGREFTIRLRTDASSAAIEEVIRSAGDIDRVQIEGEDAPRADAPGSPESSSIDAGWSSESRQLRQHRHVRIDLQRLDTLMNLIGELVITRGRLLELSTRFADPALEETVSQASRLISDLQDGIMASRMVPVWQVFDRFPRLVRDAARALGKRVDLIIEGKEIELDRSMLDELGDPVVHLLRNAVDHGLETPEERAAAGKPAVGRVVLSASRQRSSVVIRVTDDGRGIDRDRVLERAKARGLIDAGRTELTDDELVRLVSQAGFSTAEVVTDLSGRGVGVDAVHSRVRALGGTVEIRTSRGEGTSVTLRLPVTLAIVRALLARVGGETYALPMTHVNETVHADRGRVRTLRGREVIVLRDEVLPLLHLREILGLPRRDEGGGQVVVLEVGDRRAGMVVDELTGQQEIVVKPFDAVRDGLACFSGATILGDGAPALILDVGTLV